MCGFFVSLAKGTRDSAHIGKDRARTKRTFARPASAPARDGGAEVTMITHARKGRGKTTYWALALLVLGCGGRTTNGDDTDANDPDGGTTPPSPTPTCGEICRRAIDRCFPGASIEQCDRDCESTRSEYKGCPALDAFLRCRMSVPILCTDKVVFDGCSAEVNDVSRQCKR
jgi:hypothetical protein